ncbi:hypothetical protein GPK80_13965, partial [Coprococcus comes]|uniref:plasmid mobilization protein n=1 Tax=Coprococcus comes TaxID=410072 RepID=UPI001C025911
MRNREVQIKFYATEKERESIRRNAKRAGMKMGEYARAVLTSDDVSIKVIDTEPLKKAAHELAKQGTNLNQFRKGEEREKRGHVVVLRREPVTQQGD